MRQRCAVKGCGNPRWHGPAGDKNYSRCEVHTRQYWKQRMKAKYKQMKDRKPTMVINYHTQKVTLTIPFSSLKSAKSPEKLERLENLYRARGYEIVKKGE